MSLRNALDSELQSYKNWVLFLVFAIFPPYLKREKRKTHSTLNSMTKSKQNCKCSMAHAKSSHSILQRSITEREACFHSNIFFLLNFLEKINASYRHVTRMVSIPK